MATEKTKRLSIYFVIGEISGDALGADLVDALKRRGVEVEVSGLGGEKMAAHGLLSLFDISEISIMGISGILRKLPGLMARVRKVAADIIERKPDVLLLVDSPEFSKQVAKRVKKQLPGQLVVKYVSPQVWAWREGRAPRMRAYIDHILAILPFEPKVLEELGGPTATYVGHPLASLAGKTDLEARRRPSHSPMVLLMPGSRRSEVDRLLPTLERTAELMVARGSNARFVIPAVPHLREAISAAAGKWAVKPAIISGEAAKLEAFADADLAIASSGTAILELAMHGVPAISIYKPDPAINAIRFIIKAWTAALPNLIADRIVVQERINEFAHPEYIARLAEQLMVVGHDRDAQLEGYRIVHERMRQDRSPGDIAAETILRLVREQR